MLYYFTVCLSGDTYILLNTHVTVRLINITFYRCLQDEYVSQTKKVRFCLEFEMVNTYIPCAYNNENRDIQKQ